MSDAKVLAKHPQVKELDPRTYFWCSCGQSSKQPFCDGSLTGSTFSPVRFELTEKKKEALCLCKHTKKAPICDGFHSKLK